MSHISGEAKMSHTAFLVWFPCQLSHASFQLTAAGTICCAVVQHLIGWNLSPRWCFLGATAWLINNYLQLAEQPAVRQHTAEDESEIQGRAQCLQFSVTPAEAVVAQQLSASLRIYSAACLLLPPVCNVRKPAV